VAVDCTICVRIERSADGEAWPVPGHGSADETVPSIASPNRTDLSPSFFLEPLVLRAG